MKRIILVVIFVLATVLFLHYAPGSFETISNIEKHLVKWKVRIDTGGFLLTNFSESNSGGLARETLEAEFALAGTQGGKVILKMTRIQTAASQKYMDDKKFLLESLFLPTTSPYPGVITNIRECPDEFKPTVEEVEQRIIYTLFAGSRFNYGVCAKDLVEYYSAFGIFDCKEKGIFEVRIFSKTKEQIQPFIGSFSCG